MTQIRRPLLGLLALFFGALAIDRLALSGAGERTIQTPAYLVGLALVAAPLAIRGFRRTRFTVVLTMAGVGMLGLYTLTGRLTGDPYQALVEAAFVVTGGSARPPPRNRSRTPRSGHQLRRLRREPRTRSRWAQGSQRDPW